MDKFCYMPFETMAVDTTGHIMPCCAYQPEYAPFDYAKTPITVDEYFNSKELKEIQTEFLAGIIPAGCASCIGKEKYGMTSKRQKYNNTRKKNEVEWIQNRISPLYVEIAVSNRCNLTCVTCDSIFSSAWKQYDRHMTGHFSDRGLDWIENGFRIDDSFMDEIIGYAKENKNLTIELIGGEPIYNKSVIRFLENFARAQLSNCLVITTNATLVTDHLLKQLHQIKDLVLCCSIDGVGETYDYIRGFDFNVVEENIKKLLTLDSNILIMPVFSLFNVFNIPELIMWHNSIATKNNTKIKLINFVKAPYYASLENIPSFMLEDTINRLKDIYMLNLKTLHQHELHQLIKTLEKYKTFSIEKQKISLQWIEKCNIIREMDIEKIEPKLKEFIEYVRA